MKTAQEYIAANCPEAGIGPERVVEREDAEAAVQAALDDGAAALAANDQYHRLLARAIRHAKQSSPSISPAA